MTDPFGPTTASTTPWPGVDPFASAPAAFEAAVEEEYSEPTPTRHPAVPVIGHTTLWPTGKPVPEWGQDGFDPFSTFVDQTTGEVLRQGH